MLKTNKLFAFCTALLMVATLFVHGPIRVNAVEVFQIVATSITNDAKNVPRALVINVETNMDLEEQEPTMALQASSEDSSKITLVDGNGELYSCLISSVMGKSFKIIVNDYLKPNTTYNLTIGEGALVLNGGTIKLAAYPTISFTTRTDNVIKIGANGDYKDFVSAELSELIPENTSEKLSVLIQEGTYTVPTVYIREASVSFVGGYNSSFSQKKNDKAATVLKNLEESMFFIGQYGEGEGSGSYTYSFNNLTFCGNEGLNKEEVNSANAITILGQREHNYQIDVTNCSVRNFWSHTFNFDMEESLQLAPITLLSPNGSVTLNVSNSEFLNNDYKLGYSGGIFADNMGESSKMKINLTNNIFSNNTSLLAGSLLTAAEGGAEVNTILHNNTIVNNSASTAELPVDEAPENMGTGGVLIISGENSKNIVDLKNNILWGNKLEESASDLMLHIFGDEEENSTLKFITGTLNSNNIGSVHKSGEANIEITEENTLNVDPAFVNSSSDYHLTATSPMVDKGITVALQTDFEGSKRPQGKGFDIGAYELAITAQEPTPTPTPNPTPAPQLPETGSMLDNSLLVSVGLIFMFTGILVLRKKRRIN